MWRKEEIPPGRAAAIPYALPPSAIVTVRVTSPHAPVSTYFLDLDGKAAWEAGGTAPSFGGFLGRRDHVFQMRLPPRNLWYLLIQNPNQSPALVDYEVIAEPYGPGGPTGVTGPWGPPSGSNTGSWGR